MSGQGEPQALPHTRETGNLGEKVQDGGWRPCGQEEDGLLTLASTGSGGHSETVDNDEEASTSATCSTCPILDLPPPWPTGCGAEDVQAFCFICLHKEEEPLETLPLQRSVPLRAAQVDDAWGSLGSRVLTGAELSLRSQGH